MAMLDTCLMHVKTKAAIMQNKGITPKDLVDAALACRCANCNEALARYAEITLRRRATGESK